ncbi:hypothetical protein DTO166G4_6903 [Paecilomyces variotii]|nr:hypothetical protein DTO166G4_6903 [Paecilomyces variotii]KAJ9237690.1 hypothetical protein DTO166G5_3454 [Paecilomyces variotii]KAJ9261271.1 hypothetical protein DTO195F2_4297 [Paecilomyces variotii]KAJ9372838.1 hypothetical protein DTO282E5_2565 [Paecilomyces variotii]
MAAAVVQSISSLLQRATIEDHEEVLKTCNAALKKSKNDTQAQHVKVVALLNLDRYDDALRVIEEGGDALKKRAALEYAYALYKSGKLSEAVDVAARSGAGRGAKHVEAQASYRAEDFVRTAALYEELSRDKESLGNEENDLRINSWATDAQLQWKRQTDAVRHKRPSREDLESFETVYNAACGSLARGDLNEGALLLNRAKELCKTTEDLTPEDKVAELLPIAVQQLYVLIRQGKLDEAEELIKEISVNEISELSTKKIAQNNIILAGRTQENPFLLYKAFHETPSSTDSDKLFDFQNKVMTANSYSAELLVQKYDGVIRSTSKALSQHPSPSVSGDVNLLSVYNAAAHAREQVGQKGLKEILPLLENRPKDIGLVLTVVQLYVAVGNITAAIGTLESLLRRLDESISEDDHDARFNPGLLSVLIALYKREGRRVQIRSELAKAAAHWHQRSNPAVTLLRAAGASLLHSSDPSDLSQAAVLFSSLRQQDPSDRFALAGYAASHATLDPSKVEAEIEKLPSVQELVSDVDVTALEQAGVPLSSVTVAAAAAAFAGARKRPASYKEGAAKKRVRKSRLPKDYDPNKTADPERWLPLRDRSTYRPKGKKGKQRAADRTQGGIVNEKTEEAAQQQRSQTPSGGGGASSKKKKKGKR